MGEVFAGRYELVDPIGRGGVGAVWRAWDHRRRRYVAAKVLQQSDAHTLLRFVREQAVRIDHPHVLAPASWAADDDKVLFTMDLVGGGSLAHLVGDYGPLPPAFVCTLLDQLLSGLAAVHAEGVVHRDIKPANVLLEATGTRRPHLRLSDFGISMRKGEPRLTDTNFVVGTPGYFAPEQAAGAEPDFPADFFAVGLVALYLLEGAKPDAKALVEHFTAHGTPPAPKNIPEPLWQVLAGLLQPDPQARFRTATGARKALQHAAEMLPEPGPDDEVVEVFDQIGPLPAGFGPNGPVRSAPAGPSAPQQQTGAWGHSTGAESFPAPPVATTPPGSAPQPPAAPYPLGVEAAQGSPPSGARPPTGSPSPPPESAAHPASAPGAQGSPAPDSSFSVPPGPQGEGQRGTPGGGAPSEAPVPGTHTGTDAPAGAPGTGGPAGPQQPGSQEGSAPAGPQGGGAQAGPQEAGPPQGAQHGGTPASPPGPASTSPAASALPQATPGPAAPGTSPYAAPPAPGQPGQPGQPSQHPPAYPPGPQPQASRAPRAPAPYPVPPGPAPGDDPSQPPTTPAQRETSPTRPYTDHGAQAAHGSPGPHGAAFPASQPPARQGFPTDTHPGALPGPHPDVAQGAPPPSAAPPVTAPWSDGRAARRRAQRKPGPPPVVAVPMLVVALLCFAVGIWALSQS